MKAAYLTAPGRIEILDAPAPERRQPTDVLVRIDAVGVCGSDLHYYRTGGIGEQVVAYPWVLGHECAATVLEAPAGVAGPRAGDRVAIDPLVACSECDQCLAGRRHTCRRQKFLGSPGQMPGALAEQMVLPADCCFPVPAAMTAAEAVMAEPFSIALYAVRVAGLKPGARVAVLGSGPIGLCVELAAQALAEARVYSTDLIPERLDAARRLGAAWAGNPRSENVVEEILRKDAEGLTGPAVAGLSEPRSDSPVADRRSNGLDCVFECAGEQETLDQAVALLKPGGTLAIVGIPEAGRISFDPHALRRNELRILNVRRQNDCTRRAIELISSRRVDVGPLITHHFPLAETAKAFEFVSARREGVLKAIVHLTQA
jgi:L-iditol 2-dehydrogenase